jgi:rhamnulokinase
VSSSSSILSEKKALVAIDLGAESCRVSLLRWNGESPQIELIHRIPNGPEQRHNHLHWPLDRILDGIEDGLRKAAAAAPEGIRSIAVDGWAVDYVRLTSLDDRTALPLHAPYCYRDERTIEAKDAADKLIPPGAFFATTGAQPLRINTAYQLFADNRAGIESQVPWMLLPEYILYYLGGRRVAEYTNATHTGLVDLQTGDWSRPIFERLGLSVEAAPPIVPPGTVVGRLNGELAELPAYRDTLLIAPACHDTASAIAAITEDLSHTAYLVSGTWSLVGTVVAEPIVTPEAEHAGFTNQGEAGGGYCFHTNINGMWLLKQCIDQWCAQGRDIRLSALVAEAALITKIPGLIDVDSPPLLLAGEMPARINCELSSGGFSEIPDIAGYEPIFARVIFASLAARYATVLTDLATHTGRTFKQITILGGGSRNALLSRLTEEASGLPVAIGEAEGSTIGNFAIQLAASEALPKQPLSATAIRSWVARLINKR